MSERPVVRDSYGDVTGEYLALREAAGLVVGLRSLVWIEGPDAVSFCQGIVSQDVSAMDPGDVARSFLLEPRGKLRALLWLLRGDDRVGVVVDAAVAEAAVAGLERFRLRVDAAVGPDVEPLLEVWGPNAAQVLAAAGLPAPGGWEAAGSAVVASFPLGPLARFGVSGASADVLADAGARPVGTLAATTVRIEAGEPVMGVDVDEATIPNETGLVSEAVSFTKGCYLGQELVARIDARGRVTRHLRGIVIVENVLPPPGAAVVVDDAVVGRITSVGESLQLRAPVALALVRHEVEPGTPLRLRWEGGSAAAMLRELPLDDFSPA